MDSEDIPSLEAIDVVKTTKVKLLQMLLEARIWQQ